MEGCEPLFPRVAPEKKEPIRVAVAELTNSGRERFLGSRGREPVVGVVAGRAADINQPAVGPDVGIGGRARGDEQERGRAAQCPADRGTGAARESKT